MSEDFSSKTVCVLDRGLFQSWAHRLARDFGRTFYVRNTGRGHPSASDTEPGMGYFDITYSETWTDLIDQVDLWVFPDLFDSAIQEYLISQGKRVFGARRGDEMEIWREDFRKVMKKLGLKVPEYETVKGFDALRERLQEVEDRYVKTSANIRGTTETWKHIRYNLSVSHLDWLSYKLGSAKDTQVFLIEEPIRNVDEVGYDDMSIRGQFAPHGMIGVEIKDSAYMGCFMPYAQMPPELTRINEKLRPVFEEYDYRGFWSSEVRGGFLIDPTCRAPSPAGEAEQEVYANLAERLWYGAEGEVVDPVSVAAYAAQAIISSEEVEDSPLPIDISDEARPWVKLYHSARDSSGQEYVHPSSNKMSELGSVVGLGDSAAEAIAQCKQNAEGVEAMNLKVATDDLEAARKSLEHVIS